MRVVLFIVLGVLLAGCIQQAPAKPDDAKMDALFSDALEEAKTTVESITTTSSSTTTYTIKTTSTVRLTTTLSPGPTVKSPEEGGIECAQIDEPMGPGDCAKGYCSSTNLRCRYLPGSFASGEAKCVCARPK